MNNPLITVITIAKNPGPENLAATMESVLDQDYPCLEYLVIDGGSHDGSRAEIEARAFRLTYWVSEPDEGLYAAMNKGLKRARGTYVAFMNAGDRYADAGALSALMAAGRSAAWPDLLYGAARHTYPGGRQKFWPGTAHPRWTAWWRMPFSHQALLLKRHDGLQFDTTLSLCADYELILAILAAGGQSLKVDRLVALTSGGGLSEQHRWARNAQTFWAALRHGCNPLLIGAALRNFSAAAVLDLAGALKNFRRPRNNLGASRHI